MSSRLTILLLLCRIGCAAAPVRIFVDPFPDKPGAAMLRQELIKLLGHQHGFTVVKQASQADYIVDGSGETYVRGYIGTNPRVHYLNSDAQPVYSGYLSIELKPRGGETVWSHLATPRRLGSRDVDRNLAAQAAHEMAEFALKGPKP